MALSFAVVVALVFGGMLANTASAHGPTGHGYGHGHHHHGHAHYRAYPSYRPYYAPYGGYYPSYPAYPGYYLARPQPRVGFYFGF